MSELVIAGYGDDFVDIYNKNRGKFVIYGTGNGYWMYKNSLPKPDMICDKRADEIQTVDNMPVYRPEKMESFDEPLYIVVTIIDETIFEKVCEYLKTLDISGTVFHAANNVGIKCKSFWGSSITYKKDEAAINRRMKINLVCNEPVWILHKFAIRLQEHLEKAQIDVTVSDHSVEDADINHHIQFATYDTYPNDTLMISHVDCWQLVERLKEQLDTARLGICMSRETMDNLVKWGVNRNKLCYINPAHDGIIRPRKRVIGITHKTHEYDMRKRISSLYEILDTVNPEYFKFVIMGAGWENVIKKLGDMGFETEYYPEFEMEKYLSIVPNFDYYLFLGFDEGSMGYLDALAAGVKTIVTPQGFHLDNDYPIDYPCRTVNDFRNAFLNIQSDIDNRIESVSSWSWENYTKKHIAIWEYILRRKNLNELYCDQLKYEDGIYSMLLDDNRIPVSELGMIR